MIKSLLTTVFCTCAAFVFSQSVKEKNYDLSDTNGLLMQLFDADTMNSSGEALWTPQTFADELSADPSDDGWMHTRWDTVMYYSVLTVEKAVVVFETLLYEKGEPDPCHVCAPQLSVAIFERTADGQWHIERFAKHFTSLGTFGNSGMVGLAQFGENQWCLSMQMDWMGQGLYTQYLSFLNLDDLTKVFNLTIHEDNSSSLEADSERVYAFDKALHLLPSVETVNGWWEFDLVTQGTQLDDDVPRAVPANMVERYAFNLETGTYMKVCP